MIIISQNKNFIANFSNMCFIYVEEDFKTYKIVITDIDSNKVTLAKYETEERAKEVLQEIIKAYENNQKIYEMPKE